MALMGVWNGVPASYRGVPTSVVISKRDYPQIRRLRGRCKIGLRVTDNWKDRSYEPSAGDIIFFDWEGDGETDHVGIVEKCENGVVYTVEGNSGDTCRQNQYTVGSSSIYGYGVPAY